MRAKWRKKRMRRLKVRPRFGFASLPARFRCSGTHLHVLDACCAAQAQEDASEVQVGGLQAWAAITGSRPQPEQQLHEHAGFSMTPSPYVFVMGFPHVTERLLLIFWLEHLDHYCC